MEARIKVCKFLDKNDPNIFSFPCDVTDKNQVDKIIAKLNVNAESCTTHFIQDAMVEALIGDQSGPAEILRRLKKRRDIAVSGLNAINGIDIPTPQSTFYLFPKVNKIIKLINNSKKEGSKKNLLYFSNKNISNKKTKAVVPTGEI